jgi:AmmeMemoRadiSam system protein B
MHLPKKLNPNAIRSPAVADAFYPADPRQLTQMVDTYVREGRGETPAFPKAIIAPHAGYIYSGPIAGSAFKSWRAHRDQIKRVVLIGPSHYVAFAGLALSQYGVWEGPLGKVSVDAAAVAALSALPQVQFFDEAHDQEHSLEVELAFLQRILKDFAIVPVVTGEATDDEVAEAIARLWGGPETVFVISSDLSHYLDYTTARKLDRATADAIEALAPANIHHHQACGRLAIQGMLQVAVQMKLTVATVDLRNSGDTAGRKDRVVGYGAFVFHAAPRSVDQPA